MIRSIDYNIDSIDNGQWTTMASIFLHPLDQIIRPPKQKSLFWRELVRNQRYQFRIELVLPTYIGISMQSENGQKFKREKRETPQRSSTRFHLDGKLLMLYVCMNVCFSYSSVCMMMLWWLIAHMHAQPIPETLFASMTAESEEVSLDDSWLVWREGVKRVLF